MASCDINWTRPNCCNWNRPNPVGIFELDNQSASYDGVDVVSDGKNIYSTLPGEEHGLESGTSMAAPTVSGIAALLLEQLQRTPNFHFSPSQLREDVLALAKDVHLPGRDPATGLGFVTLLPSLDAVYAFYYYAQGNVNSTSWEGFEPTDWLPTD